MYKSIASVKPIGFLLCIIVTILCCKKDPDNETGKIKIVEKEEYVIPPAGGSELAYLIQSNQNINYEIVTEPSTNWLKIENWNNNLLLTAGINKSGSERMVKILFQTNGKTIDEFAVRQENYEPYTLTIDDVDFDFSTGTILGYSHNGVPTDIIIPSILGGVAVETIDDMAFYLQGHEFTSVVISEGITKIGVSAFAHNTITYISVPGSLSAIGEDAFANNLIQEVIIPEGIDTIGPWAFANNKISNIVISNTVNYIGNVAFGINHLSSLTLPNSVKYIGGGAFRENKLSHVTILNSVTYIGIAAFNQNKIKEVNGQPSNGIFYKRNNDGSENKNVIVSYGGDSNMIDFISDQVSVIGEGAFNGNEITNIILPKSVTTIEKTAFGNNELNEINIPASVKILDNGAFSNNKLESVSFEANSFIKKIGINAFIGNDNLQLITLPTNANKGFSKYKSSNDLIYFAGDSILFFDVAFYAIDEFGNIID